jgi:hypothetical protein
MNTSALPAGEANALTGRGFGWEVYYDGSSKVLFGLFAHDGTTYATTAGASAIDITAVSATVDTFFQVTVELLADGTVQAFAGFGTLAQVMAMSHDTPVLTLAGGPTSGSFANLGYPCWSCANHSTNAATIQLSMRILNRLLYII